MTTVSSTDAVRCASWTPLEPPVPAVMFTIRILLPPLRVGSGPGAPKPTTRMARCTLAGVYSGRAESGVQ